MTTSEVLETSRGGCPALEAAPERPTRPPVLLLHGAFADYESFRSWLPLLADAGHRAIAPLRRGRLGFGPERAAGVSFADYLDDTLAVVDTLDEPPVVIGHSLGGLLAQKVAELGSAQAIVLLNPAPPSMLTAQPVALRHFAPLLPKIVTGRPILVPSGACDALALNRLPEEDRPAVHARLTHESGAVYRTMMAGSVKVDATKVTVPVYVAGGTNDRIIAPGLVRKTAAHYGVEARLHEGRGHWLIGEPGWKALVADIVAWLTGSPVTGAVTATPRRRRD